MTDDNPPLMRRDYRMFEIAALLSKDSNAPNFKLGAVIAKGRQVLGVGFNDIEKTHPESPTMGQHIHAELSAILNSNNVGELRGASIYIYRGINRPLMAKPCRHCHALLKRVGIRKMFYTITDGYTKENI